MNRENELKLAQLMKLIELGAIDLPDAETDGKGAGFYADDLKPAGFSPELLERLKSAGLLNVREQGGAPSVTLGKLPESAVIPVDKVTKKVWEKQRELFSGQSLAVDVARQSKKRVSAPHNDVVVSIDLDNLEGVEILRKLTEFDRAVMNAVITLNVAGGRDVITSAMVYKILNPATKRYPSGKMLEQIGKSLDALMFTPVIIHIPGDYMPDGKPRDLKGYLVPAKRATMTINGKTVDDAMKLYETPPLYVFADGMGQIARPSLKALAVPINMNADNVALKSYLTRRVWEMKRAKSNPKVPKTILWETIYRNMGIQSGTTNALRLKRGRIRTTALQIFDYWRDCGELHGYEETTKGRTAYSVQIQPVYI